jgi:hypothetical protein
MLNSTPQSRRSIARCLKELVLSMPVRNRCAALAFALLMCAVLTSPAPARAETLQLDPAAAAECPDCTTPTGGAQVINYFEQLAPQADVSLAPSDGAPVPPDGWLANASTMVSDELALESATGAGAEAADGVASATVLAEEAAGAIPELCTTGIACPLALAIGTFGAGYLIGTGAKALYLQFHGGDDPNEDTNISQASWNRWQGPGDHQIASPLGPVVHPGEYYLQWVEENPFGYNIFSYAWHGSTVGNQCRFGLVRPHAVLVRTGATPYRCSSDPPQPIEAYVRTPEMFVGHHRPPGPAGSTDASGATSVAAPPTPSRGDFVNGVTSVLNDPASAKLRQWLQHELSPRCHADPAENTVNVPIPDPGESAAAFEGCLTSLGLLPIEVELPETILDASASEPVMSSPGDDASVARETTVKVYVNPPASRPKTTRDERCRPDVSSPAGDPGPRPPGYTGTDPSFQPRPAPASTGYPGMDLLTASPRTIRLWWGNVPKPTKGWGYRHIMERRGYGSGDEADTAAALLDGAPVPVDPVGGTSYLFHKFYDVTDVLSGQTAHCARTVLVNFFKRTIEPAPRDIITSYYGAYDA